MPPRCWLAIVPLLSAACSIHAQQPSGGADGALPDAAGLDAAGFDAARPDAAVGPIDANTTPTDDGGIYAASISLQEVNINGIAQLGQGLDVSITWSKNAKPYSFEENPGALVGCKVTEYTPAELAADFTRDEGALTITTADGTPAIPPCAFVPLQGYRCIGATDTALTTVATGGMPAGTATYAVAGATFTAADMGRYLDIGGFVTNPTNNGALPILQAPGPLGATSVVVANAAAVDDAVGEVVMFATVAGAGPIPTLADPGLLEDDDVLTVALSAGGAGEWADFTQAGVLVGDDFTLDTASQALISAIPTDGSGFALDCAGAGGACGTSLGTIVNITTTDGPVAGLPPYVMPPPAAKQVSIRCVEIGASAVFVPAVVSAYIQGAGATRIRVDYLRDNLNQPAGATHPITIVVGHGTIGYTAP